MYQISVIIPCYNAQRWISETIQSVIDQNFTDLEIIVVDDGSTDQSAEIIRSQFPSAKLIRTENHGASHARNTGTALATGKYIQYLDADDLLIAGKLKQQVELLENTSADVAYGDWQRLIQGANGKFLAGETVRRQMQLDPEIELFTDFWCPPAVYLFRREIVEKVGQWNERLPIIQDARFALDCALHGGKFIYCSALMAKYRTHETGLSKRDPVAFVRDIFTNVQEVHVWWCKQGPITDLRKDALVHCYGYVARSTFQRDPETFQKVYRALMDLEPRYIPDHPKHMKYASRLFGYKNAEYIALWYRKTKAAFSPLFSIL